MTGKSPPDSRWSRRDRVQAYAAAQADKECEALADIQEDLERRLRNVEARLSGLESRCRPSFFQKRLQEAYWTVSRALGFGHWHDGSRASARDYSRERFFFAQFAHDRARRRPATSGPRILIDVTQAIQCDFTAGIPRVVREIARASARRNAIPVFVDRDALWTIEPGAKIASRVDIREGDRFFMIDQSWNHIPQMRAIMTTISERGGANILLLYDIAPLLHPLLFPYGFATIFANWLDEIILRCDAVVTISKTVAEELEDYVLETGRSFAPSLRLGWNHLGADFSTENAPAASDQVEAICARAGAFFLTVSTLEPKKGYQFALDAVDRLWRDGFDFTYVIVGHYGWGARALQRRIVTHREYGRRLLWLDHATDRDLLRMYRSARALVAPSVAEGFGLSLVEAGRNGLPVIASDIAVFREIGGEALSYFDLGDVTALAAHMRESLVGEKVAPRLATSSWEQSAEGFFDLIEAEAFQFGYLRDRRRERESRPEESVTEPC